MSPESCVLSGRTFLRTQDSRLTPQGIVNVSNPGPLTWIA